VHFDDATAAWLIDAEIALARRDPDWPGGVAVLLAADFAEIGASGRVFDRASIEEVLADGPSELHLDEFVVHRLAEDVALVTYRTADDDRTVRRSSIWIRTSAGWRMRYHQGTVVPR
jgi:ribonuclease HI